MSKVSMQVKINHTEGINFEATTSRGVKFEIKPKDHISPLEYFALGLISCSGVDIVSLGKEKGVKNLEISSDFARTDSAPYRYTDIHIIYAFDSEATDQEAIRWVLSSLESYCTTVNTVRGVAKVSYSVIHNGKTIADKDSIASGEAGSMGLSAGEMNSGACCAG